MEGADPETDYICLECQQIDFDRATKIQCIENSEGVLIADLESRCSSSPSNGCALCQFLYAARCRPRKSHQHYQLRAYSYLKSTQTVSFSRVPKYLLKNDMPCLGMVPSGIKSRTFRVDTSEIGHIFCLDNTHKSSPMFQQYTMTNAVDLHLVHTWLGFCKSVHGEICYSSRNKKQLKRLRLIDCDSNRVVDAPAEASYVALSYVWGRPKFTTGNAASSQQSMKGSDAPFSRTISDAVMVTKALGMKFLWVDKYCIDQTNPEAKHDQISQMGLIYQISEITIIATAGDDADSGLPGVGETQRKRQPIVKLRNHSVIRTMAHPHRTIPASKWATRGWTLQESVLSSRRLVFTENQVYFECGFMNCSESLPPDLLLIHNKSNYTYPFLHRGIFTGRRNKRFQTVNVSSLGGIECYLELTMDYSKRELTYESDSYNAFTGIMEYFSREFGVHNIWGVPVVWKIFRSYKDLFARALLWYHKGWARSSEGEACRHRFDLNRCSHMTNERAIWLPSWSWIGWRGQIAYPDYSHAVASWPLKDVRLEISGNFSPLATYRESWSVASQPDALHLDVKVVTPDQMNLDEGSFPPEITLQNSSTTWFISRDLRDPRDLFKNLKCRKIELLHLLIECGASEDEGQDFFLIVENHADYAERVGVVIRKGAGYIEGTHKVVRLR